jgi:hypothetical protein
MMTFDVKIKVAQVNHFSIPTHKICAKWGCPFFNKHSAKTHLCDHSFFRAPSQEGNFEEQSPKTKKEALKPPIFSLNLTKDIFISEQQRIKR